MEIIYSMLSARVGRSRGGLIQALSEQFGFWPAIGIFVGIVVVLTIVGNWLKSGSKSQSGTHEIQQQHKQQASAPSLPPLPGRDGPPSFNG